MRESDISRQIQIAASEHGCRLFRNNSAMAWAGNVRRLSDGSIHITNPRPIHCGLGVGSADLVGIARGGAFLSVEVKSPRGPIRDEQIAWRDMVNSLGGRAVIARSVDDCLGVFGAI